jgi:hypothetical protein
MVNIEECVKVMIVLKLPATRKNVNNTLIIIHCSWLMSEKTTNKNIGRI